MKLCHMTGHKVDIITYVQILGDLHLRNLGGPQKFGRAKKSKICSISDNFRL